MNLETNPIKQEVQLLYIPKEITVDVDTKENIASFDYYTGIRYCELMKLQQSGNFNQVSEGTHFIVCCGDVMVKVSQVDYPQLVRRNI